MKVRRVRIRCKQVAEALKPWNEGTEVSNILDGDLDITDGFGIQTRDGGGADVIDPKNSERSRRERRETRVWLTPRSSSGSRRSAARAEALEGFST